MIGTSACLFRIAIVGGGPRGLAALESLYVAYAAEARIFDVHAVLFEASAYPGSGPNYAPDQFSGSLLNLPERSLELPARVELAFAEGTIPEFPSYCEWAGVDPGGSRKDGRDIYPSRARLGEYLRERFFSLARPLEQWGRLTLVESEVTGLQPRTSGQGYRVEHRWGDVEPVDEVVLAIGHQSTVPDDAMQAWAGFTRDSADCKLVASPYPLEDYIQDGSIGPEDTVAIRGSGLSMIDVVKGLTEGRGGKFIVTDEQLRHRSYQASGLEPAMIIPFSLNGLPMAAKPLNRGLDEGFEPGLQLMHHFRQECEAATRLTGDREGYLRVLKAVAQVQAEIFPRVNASDVGGKKASHLAELAVSWLQDEQYRHELIEDTESSTESGMRRFLAMASGTEPPSFDYCLSQVWRHLQKILFHTLSHSGIALTSLSELLNVHERLKRYTYGPPVDNVQCLLALLDAGILSHAVIDDPDIQLSGRGWTFRVDEHEVSAAVLIDSVLASPVLRQVSTPLVRQLLADGLLLPLDDDLGASTGRGAVARRRATASGLPPVALLGRLARGSLFGTDSITESFGGEQLEWAEGLVARLCDKADGLSSRCVHPTESHL